MKRAKLKLFRSCFLGGRILRNLLIVELLSAGVKNITEIHTKPNLVLISYESTLLFFRNK